MTTTLERPTSSRAAHPAGGTDPGSPERSAAGAATPCATAASRRAGVTARLHARVLGAMQRGSDRGDVPGWVLVTVMSAGIVLALWVAAETLLPQLFRDAVTSVRRP